MGIAEVRNDYPSVQVRAGIGFAAYYNIPKEERDHSVYFIAALTTNHSGATMVDGYGYYARRELGTVPNISIGTAEGLSISPSNLWKRISAGHVQLEVN